MVRAVHEAYQILKANKTKILNRKKRKESKKEEEEMRKLVDEN